MEIDKNYINEIKSNFKLEQIENYLEKISKLNVLIIGDAIVDDYLFVIPTGRAVKDPILSTEYKKKEVYAGGVLAMANYTSNFVKKVKLVTLIGDQNPMLDFIKKSINSNIEIKNFIKENSPTTIKQRVIDFYRNNKLFKIEYINDRPISNALTEEIVKYLGEELPKYDLVIVGDFGHGFINEVIRRKLEEKSKFLALNVQSNSANRGYNYFTLYKKSNFISMNAEELRLPLLKRFEEIDEVIQEAYDLFKLETLLVTLGQEGSIFVDKSDMVRSPSLTSSVKDTVGAGDALFAISSLFVYLNADKKLIPFIANCVGGMAVNIMGNKKDITKEKLLNFIGELYKNGMA